MWSTVLKQSNFTGTVNVSVGTGSPPYLLERVWWTFTSLKLTNLEVK
jgi:hypothetical protein